MKRAAVWILVLLSTVAVYADEQAPPAGQGEDGPPAGGAPPQMPPVAVEVGTAVSRPVGASRTFVGTVEPVRRSLVGSEFGGLVVEVLAREGDRVEANQPLARLRTTILELEIEAAQADLDARAEHVKELLNGSRPEEVKQAEARVAELDAGVALRKWKLQASEELYAKKAISEDELRDARLALKAAELLRDAAAAAFELIEAGPRKEQIAQARSAQKRQDAVIRRLEEQKRRYEIQAPFAGWVTAEHTEVGQWLSAGGPVAEIVALDSVDVTVQVVEDFIGSIREGMPARITIEAVSDRLFTATVRKIVPAADLRGRTFPVEIRLKNEIEDGRALLKAGMFASVSLAVGDERPAVLVPKDAIVLGGFVPVMVWVVGEGNKAEPVPVSLGVAVDDLVEVIGPLPPGATVVVKGNERIYMPGRQLILPETGK